jgi:hypothetical protein
LPDDLPTPRSTLRSRCVRVLVWCKACRHAGLQGWWTLVMETPTSCRVIWETAPPGPVLGVTSRRWEVSGLTQAATKVAMASMTITLLYAVLAIVLAANAVVAIAAISKIEEPGSTRE